MFKTIALSLVFLTSLSQAKSTVQLPLSLNLVPLNHLKVKKEGVVFKVTRNVEVVTGVPVEIQYPNACTTYAGHVVNHPIYPATTMPIRYQRPAEMYSFYGSTNPLNQVCVAVAVQPETKYIPVSFRALPEGGYQLTKIVGIGYQNYLITLDPFTYSVTAQLIYTAAN